MLQPFLALEHLLVHLQRPFFRPQAPRTLSGLLSFPILRPEGGSSSGLDVGHDHPDEPFSNLHNGLGVLLRLPVPSCQLSLQVLHRFLGVFQETGAVGFDFLNEVIEEGEDLRDFAVERLSQSTNEFHIERLGNGSDRGGKLE